jgi:serine/threonine-protein kinase SRPK3
MGRHKRPVAVKILVSELRRQHQEVSLHRRLAGGPIDHPGRNNVPELFDSCEVRGPNGVHQCLVMELLGSSMASLAESYTANRLPGSVAWKVCRQVVQAVAYVHRMGVVHGGLFCHATRVIQPAKSVGLRLASRQYSACRPDHFEETDR